jgi:hypothetical protein
MLTEARQVIERIRRNLVNLVAYQAPKVTTRTRQQCSHWELIEAFMPRPEVGVPCPQLFGMRAKCKGWP